MSADGKWNVVVHSPMGVREFELTVKTNGEVFSGHSKGALGENAVEGKVEGEVLSWKANITEPMPVVLDFSVSFSGDEVSGTVKLGAFGNAKVTGARL